MGDGPLIVVRGLLLAVLPATFGLAWFARRQLVARRALVIATVAALLLSGVAFALLAAAMTGAGVASVDLDLLLMLVRDTPPGIAFLVRSAALLAMLVALLVPQPRFTPVAMLAAVASATLAWNGHGAMEEGIAGRLHLIADIVHLLAAGAWIGALAVFVTLAVRRSPQAAGALAGFAGMGMAIVAAIVLTGIVNAAMLVGIDGITRLGTCLYGQLLLAKLALFALMLALAAANRFVLTPRLTANGDLRALRISLSVEFAAGVLIVLLIGWAGTLEPPVSAMS
ncbi:copper homeostasis membrane protein CopD [Sphingomonas sp. T9W2]|uniref:copper homeostasis membrane protein CopD n=1 Tax=Sphingomonas sp. T9W2 TaxID=3143183 RepID=UPI0031F54CD0